jgi:hypothetical protein
MLEKEKPKTEMKILVLVTFCIKLMMTNSFFIVKKKLECKSMLSNSFFLQKLTAKRKKCAAYPQEDFLHQRSARFHSINKVLIICTQKRNRRCK